MNEITKQLLEDFNSKKGIECPACMGKASFIDPQSSNSRCVTWIRCKTCNGKGRLHSPEMKAAVEAAEGE